MAARVKIAASGSSAPTANQDAPARNSQNIKHKLADQPGNKRPTPCLIHVLPPLNRQAWK